MTSKSVEPEESAPLLGPKKAEEVKSIFYPAPSQTQASEEGLHSYTGENDDETKPKSYFNAESAPNSIRSGAEDSEEASKVRRRGRKDKEEIKTGKEPSSATDTAVELDSISFSVMPTQTMPSQNRDSHSSSHSFRIEVFRKLRRFPPGAHVILLAEFCHSFTSYALRIILYYYLIQKLMLSEDDAIFYTQVYLFFTHVFPIIGCVLADGFFGLYKTITYLILIYGIGQVFMIVSSCFEPEQAYAHPWLDLLGLLLISVGTGALRPCMAAFGGDQFEKTDVKLRSMFFALLYTSFNLGCILAGATTPLMRDFSCLSERSCYPFPFSVSTLVLFMMMFVLIVGYKCLRSVHEVKENIYASVAKTIWTALKNKRKFHDKEVGCWLDHALDDHECDSPACRKVTLINDIRTLGKILVIFLPIPIFWTLFDQQYNNFYRQGNEMDLSLGNNLYILPDQMPAFNMLLVVILLPVFHFVIYPLCRLCCKPTYLRKMSAGMLMASLSFLMMCVIQIHLDSKNPFDYSGKAQLAVKNMLTVPVDISYNNGSQQTTTSDTLVKGLGALEFKNDVDDVEINAGRFNIFYEKRPIARARRSPRPERKDKTFTFEDMKHYLIVTLEEGISIVQTEVEKPNSGQAESFQSILFIANDTITLPKIMFCRNNNCDPSSVKNFAVFTKDDIVRRDCCKRDTLVSLTKVKNLLHGSWCIYTEDDLNLKQKGFCFDRKTVGGVHILIAQIFDNSTMQFSMECLVPDNRVHILWQIIPYTLLTIGEILFVVTGMEFSYAEAAPAMKSLVQAIWTMNMAVGNLIFLLLSYLIKKIHLEDTAYEFLISGLLMLIISIVFIFLAQFYYSYVEEDADC